LKEYVLTIKIYDPRKEAHIAEQKEASRLAAKERVRHKRYIRNGIAIARSDSQILSDRIAAHPDGLKTCRACKVPQPFHHFGPMRQELDGLHTRCFGCRAASEEPA
jgi:hypothetical protein